MSLEDRQHWEAIYRLRSQEAYPPPDPLLFDYTPPAPPDAKEPRALDLAGGQGQNGLWLAAQGYIVDVMDISRMALMRGRAEMINRGLRDLNFLQVDLEDVDLRTDRYDIICVFRYLQRDLFSKIQASLRPGGRIIYETYNTSYLAIKPDFNPAYLLEVGELPHFFPGWDILYHSESGHISRLVARKPASTEGL